MSKTVFHRLFGLGKIPGTFRDEIRREGIALCDEGIVGSVTFRNFRAPRRLYKSRKSWFTGSIGITTVRLWGFSWRRPIVTVPFDHEAFSEIEVDVADRSLLVRFDVGPFHEGWSGSIECRFSTPQAMTFRDHIESRRSK